MNSLYQNILRQEESLSGLLDRAENNPDVVQSLQEQIAAGLEHIQKSVADYEDFARKEIVMAKREKSLQRANKFKDTVHTFRDRFLRTQARQAQRVTEVQERQELFQRRAPTRPQQVPNLSSTCRHFAACLTLQQDTTVISIEDYHQREHLALHDTERHMDDFIAAGQNALNNLVEQRTILKGAHRKMLDAANTLGLSRTVIQYIERRGTQDKWIFWGGVVLCIFIMWAIVHYLT
ncbi:protein transport protein bos1 [Sorochytrium milnesiophthora]